MDFDVETQKTLKFLIMRSQKPLAVNSVAYDLHRNMYMGTDDHMLSYIYLFVFRYLLAMFTP